MLLGFTLKRIIQLLPLLFAISIIIFTVIQLPPGDYLTTYIMALELSGVEVNDAMVQTLTREYGLDRPAHEQYFIWMRNILLEGDFGRSFQWNQPVTEVIGERLIMTMIISFITLIVVWAIAIPIGIYSAIRQHSVFDYVFSFIGFIGMTVPGFLLALVAIYLIFVTTGVAFTGLFSSEFVGAPWSWAKFVDMLPRAGLAIFIIGMAGTAGLIRQMRALMLDELRKQYVVTARAKGVAENKLMLKYPVRIAVNPMVSTIGWLLPSLISGEALVSIILNLPTMGPLMLRSLLAQDMFLAGSFLLIVSVLTVIGTLISDILLAVVDPRIRFGGVAS